MVFKLVGSDVDGLMNRLGLLGKSLADVKNNLTNGQGWRSFTNIVSKQDIANFEKFQQEFKDGIKYHKTFNNNLKTSHTYIQQQAYELRRLKTEQKLLTRQFNQGKISIDQYNTSLEANKAQINALTAKTQTLTFAQKASTIASKAMGAALNMALNIGIALLINAIISGISKLVNSQQEAIDKAKEASETVKSQAEETLDYIIYHTNFTYSFSSP